MSSVPIEWVIYREVIKLYHNPGIDIWFIYVMYNRRWIEYARGKPETYPERVRKWRLQSHSLGKWDIFGGSKLSIPKE